LFHSEQCSAARAVDIQALLNNDEFMSQVMSPSGLAKTISHSQVVRLAASCANVVLTKHHVSVLFERIAERNEEIFMTELSCLWPLLAKLTHDSTQFGARVEVRSEKNGTVVKTYGVLRSNSLEGRVPTNCTNVVNARLVCLTIVWTWAVDVLEGSPPIYGLDVCHGSGSTGNIAQLSCRMARTYVPLVTQWQGVENADSYKVLLDAFLKGAPVVRQLEFSIISDRGKGLMKAVGDWMETSNLKGQQLYDKPHMWRNVLAKFRSLKDDPDALTAVKAVLYAPTPIAHVAALRKLDDIYAKVRPAAPATEAVSVDFEDGDEDDEDSLERDPWKPSRFAPRPLEGLSEGAESADTPSAYVKCIPPSGYLPWAMKYCDWGVSSSNSTEAAGSFLRSWGVRVSSPTKGIIILYRELRRLLYEGLVRVSNAQANGDVALPCWPFWERQDQLGDKRDRVCITKIDAVTYEAKDISFPERSTTVRFAPRVIADAIRDGKDQSKFQAVQEVLEVAAQRELGSSPWSSPNWYSSVGEAGIYCSAPCAGPQRFGFACAHATATIHIEIKPHSERWAAKLIEEAYAPWYRVKFLLGIFKRQPMNNLPMPELQHLTPGPKLLPIFNGLGLKTLVVEAEDESDQPIDDARIPLAGEELLSQGTNPNVDFNISVQGARNLDTIFARARNRWRRVQRYRSSHGPVLQMRP
jgi:hypothetical protein